MQHWIAMPKLWNDTIEAHKGAVADAVMDTTAALASSEGLHNVTMARIAQDAGIGRATLYKYFTDVGQILTTWHKREISRHLEALENARRSHKEPLRALEAVLMAYATNAFRHNDHALASQLHAMPHLQDAHRHLEPFVAEIIGEALKRGDLKSGAPADELARYALSATAAAAQTHSHPALDRLMGIILRGLGAER
jgi:AcrR family transcriptional regulator